MRTITFDRRLLHHLVLWLGRWPAGGRVDVVGSTRREEPGWDGRLHPAVGVFEPDAGVLSVGPGQVDTVRAVVESNGTGLSPVLEKLPAALGMPDRKAYRGVFRWTTRPADLDEAGRWLPSDAPDLPDWLRPFGGDVLIATDEDNGAYLAGVGIKRHNAFGHELSVGTEPAARGRGLARRLVAQAARRILDEGAIPMYLHDPANTASARVADAVGFADRGWSIVELG
jgi:GNAT superfamily N-acetyltransferase